MIRLYGAYLNSFPNSVTIFGEILKVVSIVSEFIEYLTKILTYFGNCLCFLANALVLNSKIFRNGLAIWSHCYLSMSQKNNANHASKSRQI